MADIIRFKRKRSRGNSDVTLRAGEPYYNAEDKKFYVGAQDNGNFPEKHIAEVTSQNSSEDAVVCFRIGEAEDNVFHKTINNVQNAHVSKKVNGQVVLSSSFYGIENPNNSSNPDLQDAEVGSIYIQIESEE